MGEAVKMELHYVVSVKDGGYSSPRGQSEVVGDLIGKCAMNLFPDPSVYLPFLVCLAHNATLIPLNLWNCTQLHAPITYSAIRECIEGPQAQGLLSNDLILAQHYRADAAPRIYLDDRFYNPMAFSPYDDYEAALCYVFSNYARPFPWFIFFIMAALLLLFPILFFVVKRWSNAPFLDTLQTIVAWNTSNFHDDPGNSLLYLRAYGLFDAGEEEEEEEEEENDAQTDEHEQEEQNSDEGENIAESEPLQTRRRRRNRGDTNANGSEEHATRRRRRRGANADGEPQNNEARGDHGNTEEVDGGAAQRRPESVARRSARSRRAAEEARESGIARRGARNRGAERTHDDDDTVVPVVVEHPEQAELEEMESIPDYYYSSDDDDEDGLLGK